MKSSIFSLCFLVSLCLCCFHSHSQDSTGVTVIEQPWIHVDSSSLRPDTDKGWYVDPRPMRVQIMERHPWFGFNSRAEVFRQERKSFYGKETFFYIMIGLLLVYALFRHAFPKYFNDLFRVFFRTTIKQRQAREQMVQTPLPSLMLNGFFVVTAGMYLSFMLIHFKMNPVANYWILSFYCIIGLAGIYLLKFVGLKFSGWLFNMREAAESYTFIVFITNKMAGIILLPFLVLLAFATGNIYTIALTLSWCVIASLLIYRFILTYATIRNQVRVNPFHFFLYLLAFEVAPLLLVYKGLLLFLQITT